MIRLVAAAVLLIGALPAAAQTPAPAACLRPTQVLEYKPLPDQKLLVVDNWKNRYRVSFANDCPHISSYSHLAIRSIAPGPLACAVKGDMFFIGDPGGPPNRCIVKTIDFDGPAPAHP